MLINIYSLYLPGYHTLPYQRYRVCFFGSVVSLILRNTGRSGSDLIGVSGDSGRSRGWFCWCAVSHRGSSEVRLVDEREPGTN